jgi:hypothetical protein
MKSLVNLPADIYKLFDRGVTYTPDPSNLATFSTGMNGSITSAMKARDNKREHGKMWFSDLGEKCDRKTWYKWNRPDLAETLPGYASFKFLYGSTLEELVLLLAREAGHDVQHVQSRVEYKLPSGWVISGRIDAVVDGVLCDVKSTSSYGYTKYVGEGIQSENDSFGYRYQLSGYHQLGTEDTWRAHDPAFLFIDKQNGHIGVVPISPIPKEEILSVAENISTVSNASTVINIDRGYGTKPIGKSGNEGLGVECSYCPFKWECWPGLQGYAYSTGPVYLTKVVRPPAVPRFTP